MGQGWGPDLRLGPDGVKNAWSSAAMLHSRAEAVASERHGGPHPVLRKASASRDSARRPVHGAPVQSLAGVRGVVPAGPSLQATDPGMGTWSPQRAPVGAEPQGAAVGWAPPRSVSPTSPPSPSPVCDATAIGRQETGPRGPAAGEVAEPRVAPMPPRGRRPSSCSDVLTATSHRETKCKIDH